MRSRRTIRLVLHKLRFVIIGGRNGNERSTQTTRSSRSRAHRRGNRRARLRAVARSVANRTGHRRGRARLDCHRDCYGHRSEHTPGDAAAPGWQYAPRHRGRAGAQPAAAARRRHCDARVLRHAGARAQEGRHRCAREPNRHLCRIAGCSRPAAGRRHDTRDRDRCRRHRRQRADPDHFAAWPGRPHRHPATQGSGAIQADRRRRSSGGYVRGSRRAFDNTGHYGNDARRAAVGQVDARRPAARCLSECQFLGFGHRRRPTMDRRAQQHVLFHAELCGRGQHHLGEAGRHLQRHWSRRSQDHAGDRSRRNITSPTSGRGSPTSEADSTTRISTTPIWATTPGPRSVATAGAARCRGASTIRYSRTGTSTSMSSIFGSTTTSD